MSRYVAFYGTLKQDGDTSMHKQMAVALEFVGTCVIPGKLLDLGRLKGLKPGTDAITGELYLIKNPAFLDVLDEYEATDNEDPSLPGFSRHEVNLLEPAVKAWVYYYDGAIPSGKRGKRWHR